MINNLFSTKRFFIALTSTASIATALSLASCQDFDNGMDDETIKRAEFTKNFIEEFGTPAPNHQWGFDVAQAVMTGNSVKTRAEINGETAGLVYKQEMTIKFPGDANQPWGYEYKTTELYGRPADITKKEHDEVFAWFSNHIVNWKYTPTNSNVNAAQSRETKDGGNKIIATTINKANPGYGSLLNYSNPTGTSYTDENNLYFFNGWIQHVAYDPALDEVGHNGTSLYSGANMDYLAFRHVDQVSDYIHLNDYNSSNGYGWGREPLTDGTSNQVAYSSGQNAILVLDAKFDVVTYGCSADGSNPHNKYYIVYLQGDDYAGYYLGMDLEGYDPNEAGNQLVDADGICNDWIIKIGDAGAKPFNPSRIMCEDLGARDFDYNDIVYDVEYRNGTVTVTVQAAGGTIPIGLYYKGNQLKLNGEGEIHTLFDSKVTTPVNVGPKGDTRAPIVFSWTDSSFDLKSIQVKVKHSTDAEWVTLSNYEGSVPLKFCVPNTVKWTVENGYIEKAYPGFKTWVGNPTKWFWTGTKDESILYSPGN